jgi:glycosyltransferase involved in cell wall biosynthesis
VSSQHARSARRRIIINDYSGHPFQIQLSRELARRGHEVLHVYSADFQTPKADLLHRDADPDTFAVKGLSLGVPVDKYSFVQRRGQEIAYGKLMCQRIDAFQPDLVIGCNNPLDAQRRIGAHCRRRSIPFIFWLQDIYSDAIKSILTRKMGRAGALIGTWYQSIERQILRNADHVVAIAEDFIPRLNSWKIPSDNVTVIQNWAPKNEINVVAGDNAWRRAHGLTNKRVALYTGTIGLKHNPELLLAAAAAFGSESDIQVVVTSEGKYADYVRTEAIARNLHNLTVLPFQAFQQYSDVLASGDVLIAMIEPDAASYSVPSKVLSYLCSGKPIVLAAEERNLAARILKRSGAGTVVSPRDSSAFVSAINRFLTDEHVSEAAGAKGRAYADRMFDIGFITDRFEHIFDRVCAADISAELSADKVLNA